MTTTEHEELDTDSASEDEDQLSPPIVYSLTMDCLNECVARIPAQDQRTIFPWQTIGGPDNPHRGSLYHQ